MPSVGPDLFPAASNLFSAIDSLEFPGLQCARRGNPIRANNQVSMLWMITIDIGDSMKNKPAVLAVLAATATIFSSAPATQA